MRKMIQKAYPVVLETKSPCKYEDHYKHIRKVKKAYPNLVKKSLKLVPKKDKRLSSIKKENRSSDLVASSGYYDY